MMPGLKDILGRLDKIGRFILEQRKIRAHDTKLAKGMFDALKTNNKNLRSFGTRMTSNNELLKKNNNLLRGLISAVKENTQLLTDDEYNPE